MPQIHDNAFRQLQFVIFPSQFVAQTEPHAWLSISINMWSH